MCSRSRPPTRAYWRFRSGASPAAGPGWTISGQAEPASSVAGKRIAVGPKLQAQYRRDQSAQGSAGDERVAGVGAEGVGPPVVRQWSAQLENDEVVHTQTPSGQAPVSTESLPSSLSSPSSL